MDGKTPKKPEQHRPDAKESKTNYRANEQHSFDAIKSMYDNQMANNGRASHDIARQTGVRPGVGSEAKIKTSLDDLTTARMQARMLGLKDPALYDAYWKSMVAEKDRQVGETVVSERFNSHFAPHTDFLKGPNRES